MNYVELTGGLGNQMFIYAFKVFLSQNNKTLLFHPYCNHSKHYGHAGFQLDTIFRIPRETTWSRIILIFLYCYWHILRLFPKSVRGLLLKLIGINIVNAPENFIFYNTLVQPPRNRTLFRGTWQSEKYFEPVCNEVRALFSFRTELLNNRTKVLLFDINNKYHNPISIHIRRNDYLSPKYISGFSGICTIDYYEKAIDFFNSRIGNPTYIVFSDDISWCRDNLKRDDIVFVDWNNGAESWQDMFLMSQCKHNIIANSSFSWWGAWLNSNPEKIVIAPRLWWNGIEDDVVPKSWVRL